MTCESWSSESEKPGRNGPYYLNYLKEKNNIYAQNLSFQ